MRMVPVEKQNSKKVRITVDYKKLNQNLVYETFPIPSFEELRAKLDDAKYF